MDKHDVLVDHLEKLLDDAKAKHFHDFASNFATPKIYLVQRLHALIENVKNGVYDN